MIGDMYGLLSFILFLLPQSIHAQTDMTREERIKILEALKESDAILEKSISGSQLPETNTISKVLICRPFPYLWMPS